MSRRILGLDLGITSVGWGIIDENKNIIKAGVRLFEEASSDNNTNRRSFRSSRRQLRRRKLRVIRMYKYLEEIGLIDLDFKHLSNPYAVRVKGLKNRLTHQELATALLHIAKRRGSQLEVLEDETIKNEASPKKIIQENKALLKDNFISEVQLEKLIKQGKVRGFDNLYKTSDYVNEVKQILSNQMLSDIQVKRIVEIIETRRIFSDGPGSIKSPTPYGRFRMVEAKLKNEIIAQLQIDGNKDYLQKTFDFSYNNNIYRIFQSGTIINKDPYNLIELMKGKCSVYPSEFRAPRMSFSAELHNFLNDLNNITYGDYKEKVSQIHKEEIIHIVREKGRFSYSDFKKYIGIKDDDKLSGFRLLKEKPTLTEFKGYNKLLKTYQSLDLPIDDDEKLDAIADVLTSYPTVENREEQLKEIIDNSKLIESLSHITGFTGTHAFSFKALKYLNQELLTTSYNQQQILESAQVRKTNDLEQFTFDIDIPNPVVRRVHKEAFKVYKDLIKEFGVFDQVIIETTRSKNSADERKRISKAQNNNIQRKENIEKLIQENGYDLDNYMNHQTALKLQMYEQQQGKCMYSGLPIDIHQLIRDPYAYQIDHIIPYSISLDDSLNNKVLTTSAANLLKGNKTPFGYFHSGQVDPRFAIRTYQDFKTYVSSNKNLGAKKKNYLLFEESIDKFSVQESFKNRNLTDTSYVIRSFMNNLKVYSKSKSYPTKVFTIRGQQTATFRSAAVSLWFKKHPNTTVKNPLIKKRDVYMHHAVDALIIAAISQQKVFRKLYNLETTADDQHLFNQYTGEVIDKNPLEDPELYKFFTKLSNVKSEDVRYSWKIDSKPNRSISDQTIYSTRLVDGDQRVVKRHANIYELTSNDLSKKIFSDPVKSGILMYKHDIQSFEILKKAYEQYAHEKYPFQVYKENHGILRKYAKKKQGSPIKTIKYIEDRLGNHIDITHKYDNASRSVVLLQLSTYRIDVYKKNQDYKFITVRYHHVKYEKKTNLYAIDENWYKEQKDLKKIDSMYRYQFSLYRNSIIELAKEEATGLETNTYRFIATNNDKKNILEFKSINQKDSKQVMITIGKKIKSIIKYHVSSTGLIQKATNEILQLQFK